MTIRSWLKELNLEEHTETFIENDVGLDLLPELSNDDLKDLGIAKLGDRKRILKAIADLSSPSGDTEKSQLQSRQSTPVGDHSEGERRQITVFFADLSGYTVLSEELDAEDLHKLVGHVFDAIDRIVENHGGTVHRHVGDEVMALFGTPVAHTDDPFRAVSAAFESHKAMKALSKEHGRELGIHVGIASGIVVIAGQGNENPQGVSDYAVTGVAANLAARLNSLAKDGQTIISDMVYQAVESHVDCSSLGDIQVKGIAKPVLVWRAETLRSTKRKSAHGELFGRQAEIAQFKGALEASKVSHHGQTVLLRGEAGMGKTRLVEEIIENAEQGGFATHKSLIFDFGVGEGQGAIRTLLSSLLDVPAGSDMTVREAAAETAITRGLCTPEHRVFLNDLLSLQQPRELQSQFDAMDNATRSQGKYQLLSGLIQGACQDQPRLLVVEDIHWADDDVLVDLAQITVAVQDCTAVLVMTTRIEGDPLDHTWRDRAGGNSLLTIDIGPLRKAEAAQLALGFASANEEFVQNCIERADGNPLFLEQLLRNAEAIRDEEVPATIQSLVLARIDRLSGHDKLALQAASAIGQHFTLDTLQAVMEDKDYSCDELREHHLVRLEGDGYLFAHALIQESVYGSLLKNKRSRFHTKAAQWFEDRDPVLYANHLDRAEDPQAPGAYLRAATVQSEDYHFEHALRLIGRGLDIAQGQPDKFALICLQGKMYHDLGTIEPSLKSYETALEIAGDDIERCHAWLGLAAGMRIEDRYEEALAVLDKAEVAATENDMILERSHIHHIRGNLYFPMGRIEECAVEHEKSLEFAKRSNSARAETNALGGVADANYVAGRMASAFQYFTRCTELARENGFSGIEIANNSMAGFCRIYLNQFDDALQTGLNTITVARKLGNQRAEMLGQVLSCTVLYDMGDYTEARIHNKLELELCRQLGAPRFEAQGLLIEAMLYRADSQIDKAIKTLETAFEISRKVGHGFSGPRIMSEFAQCYANPEDKYKALEEGVALIEAGSVSHNQLHFYPEAIIVCLELNDWDGVKRYAHALEDYTEKEPLPWSDFYIALGRALAAWGSDERSPELEAEIKRLNSEAIDVKLAHALPALEAVMQAQGETV